MLDVKSVFYVPDKMKQSVGKIVIERNPKKPKEMKVRPLPEVRKEPKIQKVPKIPKAPKAPKKADTPSSAIDDVLHEVCRRNLEIIAEEEAAALLTASTNTINESTVASGSQVPNIEIQPGPSCTQFNNTFLLDESYPTYAVHDMNSLPELGPNVQDFFAVRSAQDLIPAPDVQNLLGVPPAQDPTPALVVTDVSTANPVEEPVLIEKVDKGKKPIGPVGLPPKGAGKKEVKEKPVEMTEKEKLSREKYKDMTERKAREERLKQYNKQKAASMDDAKKTVVEMKSAKKVAKKPTKPVHEPALFSQPTVKKENTEEKKPTKRTHDMVESFSQPNPKRKSDGGEGERKKTLDREKATKFVASSSTAAIDSLEDIELVTECLSEDENVVVNRGLLAEVRKKTLPMTATAIQKDLDRLKKIDQMNNAKAASEWSNIPAKYAAAVAGAVKNIITIYTIGKLVPKALRKIKNVSKTAPQIGRSPFASPELVNYTTEFEPLYTPKVCRVEELIEYAREINVSDFLDDKNINQIQMNKAIHAKAQAFLFARKE